MPVLAWAADPQIAAFEDEELVPAGALYRYSLRIDNQALDSALNTRLTVVVAAGATYVSSAPASANCVASTPTSVVCNLGTLAGNTSDAREITLTWRATGPSGATIDATATVAADNDVNTANNTRLQDTTVIAGANLVLAKVGTPETVVGGALVSYSLTARNGGPNAAGGMVITDNLPPAVRFVSAAGAGWACEHSAGVVTCSRPGPLAVGAVAPVVTLVGQVQASGGTVTNSASIAPAVVGGVADPDTSDNTALASTAVLPGADVQIAQKSVSSALPATAGTEVSFLIQARNAGPATATEVVVTDPLPAGWDYVSATGSNWACSHAAGTVRCTRASMPAGVLDDITVVARAPGNVDVAAAGSTYTNTAAITATSADPDTGNNSGTVDVTVSRDGADLRLTKFKSPNPVALGALMTSRIRVTNQGPRVATGPLRVVEWLQGESYVGVSGAGWTCDASGAPVVVCNHPNGGSLRVRATLPELVITTRADVAGVVANTACTGSSVPPGVDPALARPPSEGDANPANDCVTANASATTVRPDLAISKTTGTPAGGDKRVSTSEDSVTYTLVVSNVSIAPQSATGVSIVDNLPGWINERSSVSSITVTPSAGSSLLMACSTDTSLGRVSCSQTAGSLAQGQQVTVAITVNRPLREGSFTNTATVGNTVEGDPDSSNNSASDTVVIDPMADVVMTGKTVTPTPLRAGEFAVYVLSFRNAGPSPATGVRVRDSFTFAPGDAGLVISEFSSSKPGSSCDVSAGSRLTPASPGFVCQIGTLANGETQSITLRVRPAFQSGNPIGPRSFQNRARIDTDTAESPSGGDNGNNEQQATLQVQPAELDLLVNKTDRVGATQLDPVPYTDGATFLGYRVTVSNTGPSYGTGVRFSEQMTPPPGKAVRFVCDVADFGSNTCNPVPLCSGAGSTSAPGTPLPAFSCTLPAGDASTGVAPGDLAAGASKAVFLRYQVLDPAEPAGDVYSATSSVSANEPDTLAGNNVATETTTTRQRVSIVTTKVASNPSPALRQPFIWTLTVRNDGPGSASRIHLTDTLPAGVEVLGPLPITWQSTRPAAAGTCTLADRSLRCEMGQLLAGGSATVALPVRVSSYPAGGTLTNTATVDVSPDVLGAVDTPGGSNTGGSTVTVQRASLSGTVFEDRDRSAANGGTLQAGEPLMTGVRVRLTGTDAYGNPVDLEVSTDAAGQYRFGDLSPADPAGYRVSQVQPAGYDNGPVDPPTSGALAPSAGGSYARGGRSGDSGYSAVVLGASTEAVNYHFPELRRPSLGGFVYVDVNGSGRFDSGDTAIDGATVHLLDAGTGNPVRSTTTGPTGAYLFSDLDPTTLYTLEQPLPGVPAGLLNGPVNPGLVGGAACAAGCTAQPAATPTGDDRVAAIDLSSGDDGTAFNFGERPTSFIAGLVWLDRNRDGVLDAAEAVRLPGVEIRLVIGTDCSAPTLATATTGVDGSFRFDGVAAFQDYRVCQTQPLGYGTGSAAGVTGRNHIDVPALALAGSSGNRFGETLASLAGAVYQDSGAGTPADFNNGRRDAGEAGIPNVPVTLSGTNARGDAVALTVTTDANGLFRFDDLLTPDASGYTVSQGAIPAASGTYVDGLEAVGSSGGTTTVNDRIAQITLPAGEAATGYLFGELPVAAISGTVYVDRNRNDSLDPTPTDARIGGVALRLVQGADCASGSTLQSTTSADDGSYRFADVAVGSSVLVCQVQPAGYANGTQHPGAAATSPALNVIAIANLPVTGSAGNDFGERLGGLAGSVYQDTGNGVPAQFDNGQRDAGEAGIAGVVVTLSGRDISGAEVNASATTDASGNFRFDDLLQAGDAGYTLSEGALPAAAGSFLDGRETAGSAGGVSTVNDRISAIVLPAGQVATGYLFGELPVSTIGGTVYIDRNRNGLRDPAPTDAPLGGVSLRLVRGADCASGITLQTTSSANDGTYAFANVAAGGNYLICQTQPLGYATGSQNPGDAANSPAANVITITDLPATGSAGNHFGERLGSLAASVYADHSATVPAQSDNGQRDAGETGISGVPITLTGRDITGAAVSRTATTDANGDLRFEDLLQSDDRGYTLTEGAIPPASGVYNDGRDRAGSAGGTVGNDVISAIVLAAGVQGSGYLFGELPIAPISGTVYVDRNRDGVLDPAPGDGRLAGVVIRLVEGSDCSAPALASTTTDASGAYSFSGVSVGRAYSLCQTQPAGYADGGVNPGAGGSAGTANQITLAALPLTGSAGNHFGEWVGSLAGSVYADHSPGTPALTDNGQRDAGEAGIAGVVVTLTGRDVTGAAVSRTALTDAGGLFRFDDLLQSDGSGYTLSQGAIPAAAGSFNDGRDTAGTAGGNADSSADRIGAIGLGAGVQASGYLFGELPSSGISGTVYTDRDRDGALDPAPADGRIAGVVIRLVAGSDCSGPTVASTTTDASGSYAFNGVSAGLTYTLCQTQPAGYADGGVNPGAAGASASPNQITLANLPASGSAGNHFGERVGHLAGSVYLDLNHDGIRQASEAGIAGVTVSLTGSDAAGAAVSRSAVTDAAGQFRFDDLLASGPAGYTLTEQAAQPVVGGVATLDGRSSVGLVAGNAVGRATGVGSLPSTLGGIVLPPGGVGTDYRFGELLPATLSGLVFIDPNHNGVQDGPTDAGLPGVALQLSGTDDTGAAVSRSLLTDADGRYSVQDLRPGTYTVTQPGQPAGTSNGQTLPGSTGGSATPLAQLPSAISGIVLAGSGAVSSGNNFAEIPNASVLQGRVWLDADNSGTLDASESGIGGVRIELTGTDTAGRPVVRDTLTDAEGRFGFAELAPGSYTLRQPAQPAGTVNGRTLPGTLSGTGPVSGVGTATAVAVTPSAIAGITLGAGQTSRDNLFGEVPGAEVSGRVFVDNNNNGRIDGTEAGLPGVNLVLTGTDDLGNPVSVTLATGPDGSWRFTDLRPGTYTVTQPTQPGGTLNGQTVPGNAGGTGSAATVAPSAIGGIVLAPGAVSSGNLFGELAESPDLQVHKAALEPRFTVGFVGNYRITVRNAGEAPTRGSYTVSDRLPAGLTLAAAPAGAGWVCTGVAGDSRFGCSSSAVIAPGAAAADGITFSVQVAAAAAGAATVDNRVVVEGGGEIEARAPTPAERAALEADSAAGLPVCAPVAAHNACRTPTVVQRAASVSGTVWLDQGSSPRLLDGGDRRLPGWQVEVVDTASGRTAGRATTGADGSYRVADLMPGEPLALRFRDPASGIVFGYPVNGETAPGASGAACDLTAAANGRASSCVGSGDSPQLTVVLAPGQDLPQQSLPVDPSGVVYDSGTRAPIPGAVVSLEPVGVCTGWNPATGLVGATLGGYTLDGGRASMTVGADGFYQFLFGPNAPASCTFGLTVTPPAGSGYAAPSALIPPATGPLQPPGAAGTTFAVQPQAGVPTGPVGPATTYYLSVVSGSAGVNVIHNHIPLDPALPGSLAISKSGDRARVEIGDSVRYTITVAVTSGALPRQTTVVDRLPAGLTYIPGTAMVGDTPIADPQGGVGPVLAFHLGAMPASRQLVLRYRVRVGVGALQGDGVNRARAHACGVPAGCVDANGAPLSGSVATAEAAHRVLIGGGVFTADACVLGKVYIDCNGNHVQDREEIGIPGVRLVMQDGTTLISDSEGKYSVCGLPPRSAVLKVDPLTLPRGARLTTSSNRNLGDAGSLWLDLKNGELHRADFVEGSCSNTVLEQTKARRAQGEVRAPEPEKKGGPALRFDSKAHGLTPLTSPQQGTDGANQQAPKPRPPVPPRPGPVQDEMNVPTTELPMNNPAPPGRASGSAPDAGGRDGAR